MVKEKSFSYYPGCSLHGTAEEYDRSVQLVCKKLGFSLHEIEDWVCCGASAAHSTDHLLALTLAADTLQKAEEKGLPLVVPCAMCFSRLKQTLHELSEPENQKKVGEALGKEIKATTVVESFLTVMDDPQLEIPIVRSLKGLKVACYYGCLLSRPPKVVQPDNPENPHMMDRVIQRLGAETVEWGGKTLCCGSGLTLAKLDVVLTSTWRVLSVAKSSGADCIAVACPMCHANLDMYQKDIEKKFNVSIHLPIFYFTQLMGLAMGFSAKDLWVQRHVTDSLSLLREKNLWEAACPE